MKENTLYFIGLATEYCRALECVGESGDRDSFVSDMVRLLPRLYMSAMDLEPDLAVLGEAPLANALDEDYYDAIRRNVEGVLGEEDSYIEVFDEDMRYSDTPLPMSIAETLADIFQPLFNFLTAVKDAPEYVVSEAVEGVKSDFEGYWSRKLCNVMRPLNELRYGV